MKHLFFTSILSMLTVVRLQKSKKSKLLATYITVKLSRCLSPATFVAALPRALLTIFSSFRLLVHDSVAFEQHITVEATLTHFTPVRWITSMFPLVKLKNICAVEGFLAEFTLDSLLLPTLAIAHVLQESACNVHGTHSSVDCVCVCEFFYVCLYCLINKEHKE